MRNQLPNSDPDLQLAKEIGTLLEKGQSPANHDDPLIKQLSAFRDYYYSNLIDQDESIPSEALWDSINSTVAGTQKEKSSTSIFTINNLRWAAAAAVLLVALFGYVYFEFWSEPSLVAESGSNIKTVQLADGSNVTLRPHSKLYQVSNTETRDLYQLSGEAYFEVTKNPSRNFEVRAGRGLVRVLGTTFTVSDWGGITQVYLEEGSVSFEGPNKNKPLPLEPGQSATLSKDRSLPVLSENTATEYTDWLRNELVFNNRSVRLIFDEIEQQFNIKIVDVPSTMLNTTLSGSLSLENRESALEYLGLSLDAKIQKTDKQTYTVVPN